jgi:hypothetical protein
VNGRTDEGMLDRDAYCRAIEAYLCRKNDGHLIRIVGPAFEMVQGWAEQGVPLKVVEAGIDRTFERYYRRGPRRRPVHISFCEGDVLDLFDDWRRALGLPVVTDAETAGMPGGPAAGGSLPAHLERVVNRLTLRRGGQCPAEVEAALERLVRELDAARAGARSLRGDARAALIARLAEVDAEVLALANQLLTPEQRAAAVSEAEQELAPFRERMPAETHKAARTTATERLVRQAAGLPVVKYE